MKRTRDLISTSQEDKSSCSNRFPEPFGLPYDVFLIIVNQCPNITLFILKFVSKEIHRTMHLFGSTLNTLTFRWDNSLYCEMIMLKSEAGVEWLKEIDFFPPLPNPCHSVTLQCAALSGNQSVFDKYFEVLDCLKLQRCINVFCFAIIGGNLSILQKILTQPSKLLKLDPWRFMKSFAKFGPKYLNIGLKKASRNILGINLNNAPDPWSLESCLIQKGTLETYSVLNSYFNFGKITTTIQLHLCLSLEHNRTDIQKLLETEHATLIKSREFIKLMLDYGAASNQLAVLDWCLLMKADFNTINFYPHFYYRSDGVRGYLYGSSFKVFEWLYKHNLLRWTPYMTLILLMDYKYDILLDLIKLGVPKEDLFDSDTVYYALQDSFIETHEIKNYLRELVDNE